MQGSTKSKGPFQFILESGIPTLRMFFGARHGKGPGDGVVSHIKSAANLQISVKSSFTTIITIQMWTGDVFLRKIIDAPWWPHDWFKGLLPVPSSFYDYQKCTWLLMPCDWLRDHIQGALQFWMPLIHLCCCCGQRNKFHFWNSSKIKYV